jgi:glycosyltransferase involved in cell wall biosynthesis
VPRPSSGRLPSLTVVTPVLDQARFLEEAIESVLSQGYPALEYVVVDGGSRDGTLDVIRRHAPRLASWVSERDGGQAEAIEKGLARGTGEVVGWLNADDVLLPGALHAVGAAFLDPAVEAVCGWSVVLDEEGRRTGTQVYPQPTREVLLRRPRLPQETVYWRRAVGARIGPLDAGLHLCFDRDYWLRMAQAGVVPRLLRRFLAGYRRHAGQKGARLRAEARAEERAVLERVHGPGADPDRLAAGLPLGWRLRRSLLRRAASLGWIRPPRRADDRR